ncbi:MAG: TonB-dependent receptor [Gemmatimonadota bacterium]|nr:TonB-dependent receptor [Gemmatimonadota bacterium]
MRRRGLAAALPAVLGCAGMLWPAPAAVGQQPGRTYDLASGAPVAGAEVRWVPGGRGSVTGSPNHRFLVTGPDGEFMVRPAWGPGGMVEVSAPGYLARALTWADAGAAAWRIGLAPNPHPLDELVVTAGTRPRRRSEVAVPIEILTSAEIVSAGAASADRLLEELPGLQTTRAAPVGSNLLIRGIGGARVLVLLDGRPAGGALLENRDLSRMSLAAAERVEVVKGPLSSLYGSDALAGVVNVITRGPAPGFGVDARVVTGTAGRRGAEASVNGGGSLRYRITGSWRQEDRVPGLPAESGDAFARVWDLRSRLHADVAGRWSLRADFSYLRERQRWPVDRNFSGFNDNTGYSGWIEGRRRTGPGEWTSGVFLQEHTHLYRSAPGDAPIAGNRDATQRERVLLAKSAFSATVGRHHFDAGAEAAHRGIRSPGKLVEERVSDRQLAIFAQDAWMLGGTVVSAGARLTWNSRWGSDLAPAAGLVQRVGERLRVRVSLARGFRAPSFKELAWKFVNLGGGYVLEGFPDLEAEHSWNLSGGIEWHPRPGVRADAEIFSNRIANLIEPGFVGHTPSGLLVYSPRNVAEAVTRGFDLRVRAVADGTAFSAGYSFLDAHSIYLDADSMPSRAPLDRRARHTARAGVSWIAERPAGLRLDLTGHLTGSAPIIRVAGDGGAGTEAGTQERQDRLTALDVQATWGVGGGVELGIGADNLFDARPEGWRNTVERRLRASVAVRGLFGARAAAG